VGGWFKKPHNVAGATEFECWCTLHFSQEAWVVVAQLKSFRSQAFANGEIAHSVMCRFPSPWHSDPRRKLKLSSRHCAGGSYNLLGVLSPDSAPIGTISIIMGQPITTIIVMAAGQSFPLTKRKLSRLFMEACGLWSPETIAILSIHLYFCFQLLSG